MRTQYDMRTAKVWMLLYTCYVTRAVYLDLVYDMPAETFLTSFRRFVARRGIPNRMLSDNAKTFKAASLFITNALENTAVKRFFCDVHIEWQKVTWQGGSFRTNDQVSQAVSKEGH